MRRTAAGILSAALLLAEAGAALAGSGDLGGAPGPDAGDAALALRMAAGFVPFDPEADAAPVSSGPGFNGDCEAVASDAAAILSAALGVQAIPPESYGGGDKLLFTASSDARVAGYDPKDLALRTVSPVVDALAAAAISEEFFPRGVLAADWDAAGPLLRNVRVPTLFYADAAGWTLWKIDARRTESGGMLVPPTPQRLSTAGGAELCTRLQFGYDFADPGKTRVAFLTPEDDGVCNPGASYLDGPWMVRLDMAASDFPVSLPTMPFAGLQDRLTGALKGWLANLGNQMRLYTPDFASGEDIGVTVTTRSSYFDIPSENLSWMSADGRLVIFDSEAPPADRVIETGYEFGTADGRPLQRMSDEESFFFLDYDKTDGGALALFRADGDGVVARLDKPANASGDQSAATGIALGEDRVAFTYRTGPFTADLVSVNKRGAPDRKTLAPGIVVPLISGGRPWVFFQTVAGARLRAGAVHIADPAQIAVDRLDGVWIGATVADDYAPISRAFRLRRIFLAGGATLSGLSPVMGGGRLFAYDAENPAAAPRALGRIPADVRELYVYPGLGDDRLAEAVIAGGGADAFYLNSERTCSLLRATGPDAPSQWPADLF